MPNSISSSYIRGLSEANLNTLLSDLSADSSKELSTLKQNAANGDANSIELLVNIAARSDSVGNQAEDILFDLFSGRQKGKIGIASLISELCLRLFEFVDNQYKKVGPVANRHENEKFSGVSKLMYMAGAATENHPETRQKISDKLFNGGLELLISQENLSEREVLWSEGRFISSSELDIAIASLNKATLIQAEDAMNLDTLQVKASKKHFQTELEANGKPIFVPLNDEFHWTSLILFPENKNLANTTEEQVRAIFFSSMPGYYEDCTFDNGKYRAGLKDKLLKALAENGIAEGQVIPIEANLQDKAPNACGVFTVGACERLLSGAMTCNAVLTSLYEFVDEFKLEGQKAEALERQAQFNADGRRQIHGVLIDYFE